jgi:hypothetical protein
MGSYGLANPQLIAAFEELQQQETAPGQWGLGGTKLPFGNELQNRFPLGGRFLDGGGMTATSQLSPEKVAAAFEGVFA